VDAASRLVAEALLAIRPVLDAVSEDDWPRPAGPVQWSCRQTLGHMAAVLMHYAAQVAARPVDHYVAFGVDTGRATTPAELTELIVAAGELLRSAVASAPAGSIAFHPHGPCDPYGYAAVGAAESLIHASDIAAGVGLRWRPADELCDLVVRAVFPGAAGEMAGFDALLCQTGRLNVPGRDRVTAWRYTYRPA
jgi:uncharacterized protein (TIGR03083 family)